MAFEPKKPAVFEPFAYRVSDAMRMIGVGMTHFYELCGAGLLDARKSGGRTLITAESLKRYIENLPKAVITTGLPHTPAPSAPPAAKRQGRAPKGAT